MAQVAALACGDFQKHLDAIARAAAVNLIQSLGHPRQTCFLSGIDVRSWMSHQIALPLVEDHSATF